MSNPYVLVLGFLAYLFVYTMLYVLAIQRRNALASYDLIRESRRIRKQYLDSIARRQEEMIV